MLYYPIKKQNKLLYVFTCSIILLRVMLLNREKLQVYFQAFKKYTPGTILILEQGFLSSDKYIVEVLAADLFFSFWFGVYAIEKDTLRHGVLELHSDKYIHVSSGDLTGVSCKFWTQDYVPLTINWYYLSEGYKKTAFGSMI